MCGCGTLQSATDEPSVCVCVCSWVCFCAYAWILLHASGLMCVCALLIVTYPNTSSNMPANVALPRVRFQI